MTELPNVKLETAVEVHEGTGGALFYHTGTEAYPLISAFVSWNNSKQYDSGYLPSVSIDPFPLDHLPGFTATVVEVHQAGTGVSKLLVSRGHT